MHCDLEPSHFYFDGSIYDKSLNPVFWYAERTGDEIILSEIKCKVKCTSPNVHKYGNAFGTRSDLCWV